MEKTASSNIVFLRLLALKLPEYREALGPDWKDAASLIREYISRLRRDGEGAVESIDDLIIYLSRSSPGVIGEANIEAAMEEMDEEALDLRQAVDELERALDVLEGKKGKSGLGTAIGTMLGAMAAAIVGSVSSSLVRSLLRSKGERAEGVPGRKGGRDLYLQDEQWVEVKVEDEQLSGNDPPPDPPLTKEPEPEDPRRYFSAWTDEVVKPEKNFTLTVQVTGKAIVPRSGAGSSSFPAFSGAVMVNVHGPDMVFPDGNMKTLYVPVKGDSAPVTFTVKATRPGLHPITIIAWNSAAQVAGLTLQVAVDVPSGMLHGDVTSFELREPEKGEYTLEVLHLRKDSIHFRLRGGETDKPPLEADMLLTGSRLAAYNRLLDALNAQARNDHHLESDMQYDWLTGIGILLAKGLLPPEIYAVLWSSRDKIYRLNIFSQEDNLPWELLYLKPPGGGKGVFIAELAGVSRWRYGPPPPSLITVHPLYLVHPMGSPERTAKEIVMMMNLFPEAKVIKEMKPLMDLLKEGNFGMLHFASHHHFKPDDVLGSYIPFEKWQSGEVLKQRFDLVFMGNIDENQYRKNAPLIFMNSCTSAGRASSYTEMSSWADSYLLSGAGGFIGSLWDITVERAPEFAEVFYGELKKGANLGDAMKAARSFIAEKDPGDPTWLAYTLYGNPLAKLSIT